MQQRRTDGSRPISSAISEAVVRATRDFTGRGATHARAIVDRDTIVVMLRDVLTTVEQHLVDDGREDEVIRMRRTVQDAMSDDLIAAVEQITGRTTIAFMSANHTGPDYSAEIFVLGDPIDA